MSLEKYDEIMKESFKRLECEDLSNEGILAVCAIRKATRELFTEAENYRDALTLFNRLTKSVVDDQPEPVRGNDDISYWDEKEKNIEKEEEDRSFVAPLDIEPRSFDESDFKKDNISEHTLQQELVSPDLDEAFKNSFHDLPAGATSEDVCDDAYEIVSSEEERGFEADERFLDEGVFEADELPDYAVSYVDDPYILADAIIESLDEDDMELFIQMGESYDANDIVRPGDVESSFCEEDENISVDEAVAEARDKFYMPAKSRIAMIRGVDPDDDFSDMHPLTSGYEDEEPDDESIDTGVPTDSELEMAESDFDDEVEEDKEVKREAVMERVEEDDDDYEVETDFDLDTLGIDVNHPRLMSDEEYDHEFRVEIGRAHV